MKSKHFFIFACLLVLHVQGQIWGSLAGLNDEELAEFIRDCITIGFQTSTELQVAALAAKAATCEGDFCPEKILAHTFKIAAYQSNVLSLCQGQAMLQASLLIKDRLDIPTDLVQEFLEGIEIEEEVCQEIFDTCLDAKFAAPDDENLVTLPDGTRVAECANNKFRTINGYCNNVINRGLGMSFRPFQRFLRPVYDDGLDAPRGSISGNLPLPRLVSQTIMNAPASTIEQTVTQMVKVWGQFLDHDITRTPEASAGMGEEGETLILECCEDGELLEGDISPECLPLLIPPADFFFEDENVECLPFVRSIPADAGCRFGPREQFNEVTSFIDGSNVYGSTPEEEEILRNFINGNLDHTTTIETETETCAAPIPLVFLPPGDEAPEPSFIAGDIRVNEQPSLASMHTIWVRVHNRIADIIARTRDYDDERIFQETRRIVIALMQHFTYNDFLPLVIGRRFMREYEIDSLIGNRFNSIYDPFRDPTITNVFATAAFRFGHTLITNNMSGNSLFFLGDNFFRSGNLLLAPTTHPSSILEQEARMQALPTDVLLDPVLTTQLQVAAPVDPVAGFPSIGGDLMARNILRGREHGIPGYNAFRQRCGLSSVDSFGELRTVMSPEVADAFESLYQSVDDIDLFPAGLAENPAPGGGILGPTFSCIIANQFASLKYGDRFFYENSAFIHNNNRAIAFTTFQLRLIKDTLFSEILCEVTCASSLPRNVYRFDEDQSEITCGQDRSSLIEALEADRWF